MTTLRDFLNWFEGFSDNIELTPNEKQWAKIRERIGALNENESPIVRPTQANMVEAGIGVEPSNVTDMLKQIENLKRTGAAAAGNGGGAAMDAGPPPAMVRRK
jgi:hypothetical protein